ncbi:hypothetical protein T07_11061 [Trichinella nelsoni]|uniref:Uncharacterized protein n=1 Tax=Trichinella nelsoni TaxID=6336 RepID=A0A0V0SDM8_9BILA|nr:hypothetical protein T07_11061 [Trichinella nelsoni]
MRGIPTANLAQATVCLGVVLIWKMLCLSEFSCFFLRFRYFLLCDVGNDWETSSVEAVRVDVINCSIV